jgi:hypothetical protein
MVDFFASKVAQASVVQAANGIEAIALQEILK